MSHSPNKSWYSLHNTHSPQLLYNYYNMFHHHDNPMDMFQNSHMVNTPNHYHRIHYYTYNSLPDICLRLRYNFHHNTGSLNMCTMYYMYMSH